MLNVSGEENKIGISKKWAVVQPEEIGGKLTLVEG